MILKNSCNLWIRLSL